MTQTIENDILIPEIGAVLREGKQVRFTPLGVSMRPWIEGGRDSVVLKKLPQVRVGDMVLADLGTRFVLHRVVRVLQGTTEEVILMGDGNIRGEEQCRIDAVLGTVICIEDPQGRRKPLTKGVIWRWLLPIRKYLLKIYRKIYLPHSQYR